MSTKSTDSPNRNTTPQVEIAPQLPMQQALDTIRTDSEENPRLFLNESEVPHGGE